MCTARDLVGGLGGDVRRVADGGRLVAGQCKARRLERAYSRRASPPAASSARPTSVRRLQDAAMPTTYERWTKTRMANVVRDPREHPDAIIPDFDKPDPLLTFKKDDIAFVYGSKWKQRYFKKVGDDYFPLPAQWDVTHKIVARRTSSPKARTGGCRSIRPTTCSGRPARSATAATR